MGDVEKGEGGVAHDDPRAFKRLLDYQAAPGVAEPFKAAPVFAFTVALAAAGVTTTYAEAALAGWPDTNREHTELKLSICMFVGFAIIQALLLSCSLAIHLRTTRWIWRSFPTARATTIGLVFHLPLQPVAALVPGHVWLTIMMWVYLLGVPLAVARLLLVRERLAVVE